MILIIDDDVAVRTSLMLLLQNEGYEVMSTGEPTQAISLIKEKKPQLIILDLNFSIDTSGKEGMQLLGEIKEVDNKVPIILITGWGTIELAVQGMKMGASDFLNKPWSNDHVIQSVKTLLDLQEKKTDKHTRKQLDALYNFRHIIGEDEKSFRDTRNNRKGFTY